MSISICIFHEIYDKYEHLIYHNEIKQIFNDCRLCEYLLHVPKINTLNSYSESCLRYFLHVCLSDELFSVIVFFFRQWMNIINSIDNTSGNFPFLFSWFYAMSFTGTVYHYPCTICIHSVYLVCKGTLYIQH